MLLLCLSKGLLPGEENPRQFTATTRQTSSEPVAYSMSCNARFTRVGRAVGNVLLTQEDLATMHAEVERVLNSRPIAALSSDPNDGEALTPVHLILGKGLRSLPPKFVDGVRATEMKLCKLMSSVFRASPSGIGKHTT